MALINTLTRKEFEMNVLENNKLVLVDFWAAWCMPCRAMAPILKDFAERMEDKLTIVKVNVEESQDNAALAGEYGVQSIPNMQLFKNGKVVDELIGARPAAVLQKELDAALEK